MHLGVMEDWQAILAGLQLVERELLVFAVFWFLIGMADEIAIDLAWLGLRFTGRAQSRQLAEWSAGEALSGPVAVFVPAWREAEVIGATVAHMLAVWPQRALRLYVGCYANDLPTLTAAMAGAGLDPRVRLVIHGAHGPTTKADCLNRLYEAMATDERRTGAQFHGVVLHDAEDMVHPYALSAIDRSLMSYDFVQLPVRPEPQSDSRWIAGHYADEFAEAHAKAMVVRDALGAGIPAAGVGCGIGRDTLARLARLRRMEGEAGPFAADCLTEDSELGLLVARGGGRSCFLRLRDAAGALVATRSYFPADIRSAVRQKTRWVHGIAFQGWERLGWSASLVETWMALRDRRGPLTALVLAVAYALLVIEAVLIGAQAAGIILPLAQSPTVEAMIRIAFTGLLWRAVMRFFFTAREYGLIEGVRAVARIPIANIIAIMAGRRAFVAYLRSLRGDMVAWDKTAHHGHPATAAARARVRP